MKELELHHEAWNIALQARAGAGSAHTAADPDQRAAAFCSPTTLC